ncbi:HBS1-like protein (ERFS), partial [Durusdinium trenchii]
MGHLLYKLKYVTQREMRKFEKESKDVGKGSFAFAWVLDEHEEERSRGVTVDVGVKYFETEHRRVTLLDVVAELKRFLLAGGYAETDLVFCPVSGLTGANLVERLPAGVADWYEGPSLAESIDTMPPVQRPAGKPLRMVVVDVFKTILLGPITVSGKIEAGVLEEGDQVLVAPNGVPARVKAIQRHLGREVEAVKFAKAGENVDVGLAGIEDNMVNSSCVLCDAKFPIPVVAHFVAEIATLD